MSRTRHARKRTTHVPAGDVRRLLDAVDAIIAFEEKFETPLLTSEHSKLWERMKKRAAAVRGQVGR